jgi:hypothetical protein
VPWLGESGIGGFDGELQGTGTEPPEGLKREGVERMFQTALVGKDVPAHVCVPKSSWMVRDAGSGMKVRSTNGMDERHVCENVTRAGVAGWSESPSVPEGGLGCGAQTRSFAPHG